MYIIFLVHPNYFKIHFNSIVYLVYHSLLVLGQLRNATVGEIHPKDEREYFIPSPIIFLSKYDYQPTNQMLISPRVISLRRHFGFDVERKKRIVREHALISKHNHLVIRHRDILQGKFLNVYLSLFIITKLFLKSESLLIFKLNQLSSNRKETRSRQPRMMFENFSC